MDFIKNAVLMIFSIVFLVSGIMIILKIIAMKRHSPKSISTKTFLIAIAACIISLSINIAISSSDNTEGTGVPKEVTSSEKNEDESETEDTKKDDSDDSAEIKQYNEKIAASLKENQGFANGTLDKDGNPTDNGTPNDDFNWALYINSIKYAKDKSLEVQVINDFKALSIDDKKTVINSAQNSALAAISEVKDVSTETYQSNLYVSIYNGTTAIGHSRMTKYTEFKWYNE